MKSIGLFPTMMAVLSLAAALSSCAPPIPHAVKEQKECVTCHGSGGIKPYPAWHAKHEYKNSDCSNCHDQKISDRNVAGTHAK